MNCSKVQRYIPDLRTGNLSQQRKDALERHLAGCENCQKWLESWESVCSLYLERITPPAEMNWTSFQQAIEAELKQHPLSGRKRQPFADLWQSLVAGLWIFPKRSQLRALFAGAAVGFVLFIGSHFVPTSPTGTSNLTIGGFFSSEQQGT